MRPESPSFTIVIPCHNGGRVLARALDSVRNQTYDHYEVICIDDGSTDDSAAVATSHALAHEGRLTVLRQNRRGPGAARNRGIRAATHDWIAFLDSDDDWLPEKLERVATAIRSNPDIGLVCHDELEIDPRGKQRVLRYSARHHPQEPFFRQLYVKGCYLGTSALVVQRDCLLAAGLFDETLMSAQDYELWLRVASCTQPQFIDEVLARYLIQPNGVSANVGLRLTNMIEITTRHFPRFASIEPAARIYYARRILRHYASALRSVFRQAHGVRRLAAVLAVFWDSLPKVLGTMLHPPVLPRSVRAP